MNETNYFLRLEFKTKEPAEGSTMEEAEAKHIKVVGFIESRIKNFLQVLQLQLGGLGFEEGIIDSGNLLILPESPFENGPLSSVFVIALPCVFLS